MSKKRHFPFPFIHCGVTMSDQDEFCSVCGVKESDLYETPPEIMDPLIREFGPFDLDPCAEASTAKAPLHFGRQADGTFMDALKEDWSKHGKRIFLNPPYSKEGRKDLFIQKASEEARKGSLVVCLLPVKTSTKAFHAYIEGRSIEEVEKRFLKGRIKFLLHGHRTGSGRFDSMFVIFKPQE